MVLCVNQTGPPVLACQNALASALGARSVNARNGNYGSQTAADVALYRSWILGVAIVADGLMLDTGTIDTLTAYMSEANLAKLDQPLTSDPAIRADTVLFNQGDEGPPIGAAQNSLASVLNPNAANARNGSYGSNTAADLRALAKLKNIPAVCDGRGLSYIAWQVLLGYMNEANRANAGKPLRGDVPAMQVVFNEGDAGPPIEAMQAALASLLGAKSQNARNGNYGSKTAADLVTLRGGRAKLTPVGDGSTCPKVLWDYLYSYMNAHYQELARMPLDSDTGAGAGGDMADIAREALAFHDRCRGSYTYAQVRPYPPSLYDPAAEDTLDCSSSSTLIYKQAGAPDPSGRGFDGYGWTGSMQSRGERCDPTDGALAFYGPSWDATSHVAVVVDGGRGVVSFGHTPIEHYGSVAYRGDYLGCRRYF